MWGDSEESELFYTNFCHMFGDVNKKEFKLKDACEAEMEFRATVSTFHFTNITFH